MHLKCLSNPNQETRDVIITTVPWTDSSMPLMAPAALKPIVESAGYTCLAIDANVEIYHASRDHPLEKDLIAFFFDGTTSQEAGPWLRDLFQNFALDILVWKPKIIGLSLLSYVCQNATRWLCWHIKKLDPDIIIIVGGPGCLNTFVGESEFVATMKKHKLIDHHIRGDGEHSLYELLKGNKEFLGIDSNTWQEMDRESLSALPIPNYDDYDLLVYDKQVLPLVGSRGCVRQCTFCDYIANWKKFQWRTAQHIFNEMLEQNHRYGIGYFKFQDSLTNGNMKEFSKLMALVAEHNQTHATQQRFKWSGYYIFRDVTANIDRDWDLLSRAGADVLVVGVENLNEHIRYAIGKKFSNASIDKHLELAQKYNIRIQMLNIVGYITETQKDIEFAKNWLVEHVRFRDMLHIQWGGTLGIFPDTWLERHQNEFGIIRVNKHPQGWINPNIGSTPKIRAQWVQELNQLSIDLGYTVADNVDNHFLLESMINV